MIHSRPHPFSSTSCYFSPLNTPGPLVKGWKSPGRRNNLPTPSFRASKKGLRKSSAVIVVGILSLKVHILLKKITLTQPSLYDPLWNLQTQMRGNHGHPPCTWNFTKTSSLIFPETLDVDGHHLVLIEVQLIYTSVLVSGVQHRASMFLEIDLVAENTELEI